MIDILKGHGSRNADLFVEVSESELRRMDEDRADRDRAIADSLTDEDVALIFSGEFDIVPRRREQSRNKIHTFNGHDDGYTVTADLTVGVNGFAGGFTVEHLEQTMRKTIGQIIGPSFTIVQVARNADDEVVYEL